MLGVTLPSRAYFAGSDRAIECRLKVQLLMSRNNTVALDCTVDDRHTCVRSIFNAIGKRQL